MTLRTGALYTVHDLCVQSYAVDGRLFSLFNAELILATQALT